jgi:hypothetical protein
LTVRTDGRLARRSGAMLSAAYVVAPPGVVLGGRRLASGMTTNLVLWQVGGQVRVENARTDRELLASPCGG